MPRLLLVCCFLLPAASLCCAAPSETVLFDLDLTKEKPAADAPGVKIVGGEWDAGWRTTAHGQRIILDAGRPIKNGLLEVWFTKKGSPINPDGVRAQWLSLHERDGGLAPEYVQLRSGVDTPTFAKLRTKSNEQAMEKKSKETTNKRCEVSAGKISDWIVDDTTVMHVTIRWQDGIPSFTTPAGEACACTKYFRFPPPYTIDSLRYAYLGSDRTENGGALLGLRFKRVRFTELGKPASPAR